VRWASLDRTCAESGRPVMAPSSKSDLFASQDHKAVLPSDTYHPRYSISHARRRESKGTGTSSRTMGTLDSDNTVVDLRPEDLEPLRLGPLPKRRLS
jgi:hypothetical protein